MTKILKKLLILLMFSVMTVAAQSAAADSDCNIKYGNCVDKCAEADDACMDACEENNPCPEEDVEVSTES